jgi:hypothetical protein
MTEGLALIKSQIEASPGFDDIAGVTDKKRRLEMLREKVSAPRQLTATKSSSKAKSKKKQSSKKGGGGDINGGGSSGSAGGGKNGVGGGGGSSGIGSGGNAGGSGGSAGGGERSWTEIAQDNGWQKVETRKKVVVVRAQPSAAKHQSAVVIYTQASAKDFMDELARKDHDVAEMVASTRQKEGHVVLMATTEDVQALKECLPWFKNWGMQAKEYMLKPGTLANSAAQGWKDQTREAGVCHHFLKGTECPFRGRCKFKCYPPEGEQSR